MDKLLKGFKEFREETYEGLDALMPKLVKEGQEPDYFIISCIDSRSNAGTLFNAQPGTFFSHKAMGAIVRPYHKGTALAAALQFAITHMNVSKIIILGHSCCGAVNALIENIDDDEISSFLKVAQKGLETAKNICKDDKLHRCAEEQILLQSIDNLKTYPSVKTALDENRLTIKPWFFDMEKGSILEYREDKKDFITITKTPKEDSRKNA